MCECERKIELAKRIQVNINLDGAISTLRACIFEVGLCICSKRAKQCQWCDNVMATPMALVLQRASKCAHTLWPKWTKPQWAYIFVSEIWIQCNSNGILNAIMPLQRVKKTIRLAKASSKYCVQTYTHTHTYISLAGGWISDEMCLFWDVLVCIVMQKADVFASESWLARNIK